MKACIHRFPKHMLDLILPFDKKKSYWLVGHEVYFFSLWVASASLWVEPLLNIEPVRGKVPKTIDLQGNSQYWKGNEGTFTAWRHFAQQGSWTFCCWEFYDIYLFFVCDFFGTNLDFTNQPKQCFIYFFSRKDIVHWSNKITKQSHAILEST